MPNTKSNTVCLHLYEVPHVEKNYRNRKNFHYQIWHGWVLNDKLSFNGTKFRFEIMKKFWR